MGIKISRQKPKQFLLGFIYRAQKLLPFSAEKKFKLFLDLEWIFDRLAHEFSFKVIPEQNHPLRQYSIDFMLQNIQSNETVLDLGCNYGMLSYEIAKKAKTVVGVDINESALTKARQTYKRENLSFVSGEAREFLKSSPEKFDILLLSHILEHLDDPKGFILGLKESFKKIYIEVPDFDKTYLNHYRKLMANKLIYTDDDHVSEFDRTELLQLLKECELDIEIIDFRFGVMKLWCRTR